MHRLLAAAFLAACSPALAQVTFTTGFDDPNDVWTSAQEAQLAAHAHAAGDAWGQWLGGTASLHIVIRADANIPRATGRSVTSSFVANRGGFDVFEQAFASEARTGVDPNGAAPDIELVFNPLYITDELWLDPQPTLRTAPVPADRTDAMSVFIHELGHALCFNGWSSSDPGDLFPFTFRSTFDENLQAPTAVDINFNGPHTVALYGGPVPITTGNPHHLGNPAGEPGEDLLPALMNGVVFLDGTRYSIGPIELVIALDSGVLLRCPADIAGPGQVQAPDGQRTADDLIVFVNRFFAQSPLADIAGPGQAPGADGEWTADDLIVFVNRFFSPC
jgi:hypothetical protein